MLGGLILLFNVACLGWLCCCLDVGLGVGVLRLRGALCLTIAGFGGGLGGC